MPNHVRKIQVLTLVFVIILLTSKFYLHISPGWDPFQTTLGADDCCIGDDGIISQENDSIISTPSQEGPVETETVNDNDGILEDAPYPKDPRDVPFTIVTGASENHFCPLKSFLYSTFETVKGYRKARIVVYDIGLSEEQRVILGEMQTKGYLTELRLFNWTEYPAFWHIKYGAPKGEYAWKPGMVYEMSQLYPGVVIWLDSGTKVKKSFFKNMIKFLDKFDGLITPSSPGCMKDWTHPGVYEYFNDDHSKYDKLPNCNGASIAFDTKRTQALIDAWYECALEKHCIAPPGSSRKNHRQDQALLTYLAAKEGRICDQDRSTFGFTIHDDNNCRKENELYESEHDIFS